MRDVELFPLTIYLIGKKINLHKYKYFEVSLESDIYIKFTSKCLCIICNCERLRNLSMQKI